MAKSRISGITIQINGDTTDLEKSLKSVNQEIKDTQNALRDVEKLLKLDPSNTELLAQKQQLLSKAVEDTSSKLEQLKKAQEQMKAEGVDQNSKAYQGLTREIASTELELNKLKTAAQATNDEINKTTSVTEKLTTATKKFASGAETVAKKTKLISAAAGGALASLVALGINAGKDADELNTIAKQTGLSTDSLQKMKYAADLVDVDVETITSAVKKMKKGLDSNADAFEKIGVSTKDANGEFRDTEDIFFDVVEALGQIENETERDVTAMDIFGRSADELAGIIDDGGDAMKALGKEAEDKGLIISKEDLDNANELNDTLDKLKATVSGSLGKAAISAAQALGPVLETLAGIIEKIAGIIGSLSPEAVQIITVIAAAIAVISPIASIIATIATTISTIIPIITTLNAVIAANPVVLIIAGIVAAIAGLIAIGVTLYKHWDEIKEFAGKLFENLSETFNNIKEAVVEKFNAIKEKVTEIFTNIRDGIKEKFDAVKEIAGNVLQAAKDTASEKLQAMKQAFEENGGGMKGAIAAAWEGVKGYYTAGFTFIDKLTGGKLSEITATIKNAVMNVVNSAKTWGQDLIDNLVQGIKDKIQAVKDAVSNVANTIKDFLGFSEPDKGPLSNFHTFMPDMLELMKKGIDTNLDILNQPLDALASKVAGATQVNVNYNNADLNGRLDTINDSINANGGTVVKVEMAPSIQNLFRAIKTEEYKQSKAMGGA